MKELFVIGQILKTRGLKGEVKVQLLTDFPERFKKDSSVLIGKTEKQVASLKISSVKRDPQFVYLQFDTITTVEQAELIRGQYLFTDSLFQIPKKSQVLYIHELIGYEVVNEKGERIGELTNAFNFPANDAYEISAGGKSVLIPAIADFVKEVNTVSKRVVVLRYEEFLS